MWDEQTFKEAIPTNASQNDTYWVQIKKSRFKDVELPWIVKLYPPGAECYFDYEESTRAETFEQAIKMADYFLGAN